MHLPLQSGSSRILKIMNLHYDKEQYLTIVKKLREAIPDIALTTDIIVGFPGETEEDFQETLEVVKQVEYDSAFTFIYSKRTGTPAAAMEDQCDPAEVKRHFDLLLKEVQQISAKKAMALEGIESENISETTFWGFKSEDYDAKNITQEIEFSRYILYASGKSQCYQDTSL